MLYCRKIFFLQFNLYQTLYQLIKIHKQIVQMQQFHSFSINRKACFMNFDNKRMDYNIFHIVTVHIVIVIVLLCYQIIEMMASMIKDVQYKLLQSHEQMQKKSAILPYFVSLQFPQKQRRIVHWWQSAISDAIRFSNQVYLSPSDLQLIFTMHNLKPVPLKQILHILNQSQNYQWRDNQQLQQQTQKSKFKQFISTILSAIIPQKSIKNQLNKYKSVEKERESKFVSLVYLREKLDQAKAIIRRLLGYEHVVQYDAVVGKLKSQVKLSPNAIQYLVKELDVRLWIKIQTKNELKLIIYSQQLGKYTNRNWIQVQKQKYQINRILDTLQTRIKQYQTKQKQQLSQAKHYLQNNNQKRARTILQKVKNYKKILQQTQLRRRAIQDQLHMLQINQCNGQTVNILEEGTKLIKETGVDQDAIQKIMEEGVEIQARQNQINMGFEGLVEQGNDLMGEEVDQMMRQIENDIKKDKKKVRPQPQKVQTFISTNPQGPSIVIQK